MDYGQILTQAGKVLWKHKVIYGFFVAVFSFPSILYLLGMGVFAFTVDLSEPERFLNPTSGFLDFRNPPMAFGLAGAYLVFLGFSLTCAILSVVGVLKGVSLAENGADSIDFLGLWQASLPYFWRVSALFAVLGVVIFGLMLVLMLPTLLIGFLSFPLFCVFIPGFLLGRTGVELVIMAIVQEDLGFVEAFKRVWHLLQRYFGPLVLMTIVLAVIEVGANLVVTLPLGLFQQLVMQFWFLNPLSAGQADPTQLFGEFFKIMFVISLLVMPLMLAVQGLTTTYHLTATALTYLRLKPQAPLPGLFEDLA